MRTREENRSYMRRYRARNPAKFRAIATAQSRKWRQEHPEENRVLARKARRRYKQADPARYREQMRRCLLRNPHIAMANRVRDRINRVLAGRRKFDRTFELVGCSPRELKSHLESQFKPGMSWTERSLWHIDHITPISFYDLTLSDEQHQAFHWSNLQPLWAINNLSKGSKLVR